MTPAGDYLVGGVGCRVECVTLGHLNDDWWIEIEGHIFAGSTGFRKVVP